METHIYIYISNCLRRTRHRAGYGQRKHTGDVDMRRAYPIGVLDSIGDTLKLHTYWLNGRVKAFVVCCCVFVHELERQLTQQIGH